MPSFCNLYSGICLYLLNSVAQLSAENGGNAPVIGFHSVIDNPLSVRRVKPPTNIINTIRTNRVFNHN